MNLDQLKTYCSTDIQRKWVTKPFTVGDFTFATDGRILFRVPAIAEVPEDPDATKGSKGVMAMLDKDVVNEYKPLPPFEPREPGPCPGCDGRGKSEWVECPDCTERIHLDGQTIVCLECGGLGRRLKHDDGNIHLLSVDLGGTWISVKYYEILSKLPKLTIATNMDATGPLHFKFDGGDGLLMPMTIPPK